MAGDKRKRGEKHEVDNKRTKEETAVAKHLRFTVPTFKGKLAGIEVTCFKGEDAVNVLQDSKWTKGEDALFTTRASCASYCQRLLQKGTFHLAERERRKTKKRKEKEIVEEGALSKKKKPKKKETEVEATHDSGEDKKSTKKESSETKEDKDSCEKKEKKKEGKKKRKVRLLMPDTQFFEDGDDVYVWLYDPTPLKNYVIGGLMVFGSIGLCLFPLWPPEVRLGIYYLSVCCACLLGVLLFLVVVRTVLFGLVWLVTAGKHHFWLLPNLTEDVGVLESFQPFYTHWSKAQDTSTSDTSKDKDTTNGGAGKDDPGDPSAAEPGDEQSADDSAGSNAEDSNGFEMIDEAEVPAEEI